MSQGKQHTAEQDVNLLRQVEVGVANGKPLPQACMEVEIVEQSNEAGETTKEPERRSEFESQRRSRFSL